VSATPFGERRASGAGAIRLRKAPRLLAAIVIVVAFAYSATFLTTEGEPLLVAPLVGALVAIAVLSQPLLGVYLLLGAAVLFEQWEITGLAPLTAQTHFFQNISGFSNVPIRFSASDMLAALTCVSWAMRRFVGDNAPARAGPFGLAVAAYGLVFVFAAVVGAARGGNWNQLGALAEARGPVYACLLYFLTANLVHDRRQLAVIVWEIVLLVGVKAFQAIGNYGEMMNGPYRLEAVTAHEDVVFFDLAITLVLVLIALRLRGKLFYAILALQPVILTAELLTQRRVAFAALAVAIVVVALMSALERPRLTAAVAAVAVLAFGVYAVTFWDRQGPLAEPVRVIRDVVDPYSVSDRDRLSNVWRDLENANIAYTVRQLPLTGVGLGREYLFQVEPPPLAASFTYWRYMTHNAVLWMWLKAGPFGAFALWFLVAQVIIKGLALYRRLDDPFLRAAAAVPVLLTVSQVVFSAVDLGLTYNRTMIVLGVALGLAAPLCAWAPARGPSPLAEAESAPAGPRSRAGLPAEMPSPSA
jgi:hypothetical protein